MSEHVQVTQADGICEIRLNRPQKRNAITAAMYEALWAAIVQAEGAESVRVIFFSGAGACFSAGNDLNDFLTGPPMDDSHPTVRFLRLLPKIRKVALAAVHGPTVGIGVTLLLHCDLVVAARSTRLLMPFVTLGLVPEAGSSLLLPRLVGQARAAELLLLGTPIDADAALEMGLVNRVTDDDKLPGEARAVALAVAAQPAGALRATKQLLRGETGLVTRIEEEMQAFQERLASDEFKAAARAFLNNKPVPR